MWRVRRRRLTVAAIALAALGLIAAHFLLSAHRAPPVTLSPAQRNLEVARFNNCVDMAFCLYQDKWPPEEWVGLADYTGMMTQANALYKTVVQAMQKAPQDIAWQCLRQRMGREPSGRSAFIATVFVRELQLTCAHDELRRLVMSHDVPQYMRFVAAHTLTYFDDWSGEEVLWESMVSGAVLPPDMAFTEQDRLASHRYQWRGNTLFRLAERPSSPSRVRRFCELLRDKRMSDLATMVPRVLGKFRDDPLASSVLEEGLGDKSLPWLVRRACAGALGEQGHRSSLPVLAKALYDERESLWEDAAVAIGKITGQDFEITDKQVVERARRWWAGQQKPAPVPEAPK